MSSQYKLTVQSAMHARVQLAAAVLIVGIFLPLAEASAVSVRVRVACAKDYFAHCSQFSPNSPEVRRCMRSAGNALSPRCVSALVADGEVSSKEVSQRVANKHDDD